MSESPSTPLGWTRQLVAFGPETPHRATVFTKVAEASEPPTVGVKTATAQMTFASVIAVRYAMGVDVMAGLGDASAASVAMPTVTTTVPDTLILHAVVTRASEFRPTTWSGATEMTDHGYGQSNELGVSLSTAQRFQAAVGATPVVTSAIAETGTAAAATIAIK